MEKDLNQKSMRRESKKIIEQTEIEEIILKSLVCRVAVCKNNVPYIIPLSFGFDGSNIYIHTATEGRKIEFWESNPVVCFEFDSDVDTIPHNEIPCKWTTTYRSVIGYGEIFEITGENGQLGALNQIMLHYSGKKWEFNIKDLKAVRLWQIKIVELSGKKSNL